MAKEEDFKVGIIDECAHYVRNYDQLLWRITNSLPRMAVHPAYLRVKGQPVWFVYQVWDDWLDAAGAERYTSEAEASAGDVFWIFDKLKTRAQSEPESARMFVPADWLQIKRIDSFGTYSYFGHWRDVRAATLKRLYAGFVRDGRGAGKITQLPFSAGHDNSAVSADPCAIPRRDGKTLEDFLDAIDAAAPDIAVVCSFNEWLEMTQVEPSANWPDPYLYLKIIARWRGKEWKAPPLPK